MDVCQRQTHFYYKSFHCVRFVRQVLSSGAKDYLFIKVLVISTLVYSSHTIKHVPGFPGFLSMRFSTIILNLKGSVAIKTKYIPIVFILELLNDLFVFCIQVRFIIVNVYKSLSTDTAVLVY